MDDIRRAYADVRAARSVAYIARQHALAHGSPEIQTPLAGIAERLMAAIPGTDGSAPTTLGEIAADVTARLEETGGKLSEVPSQRAWRRWTDGLPLDYSQAMEASEDVARRLIAYVPEHSPESAVRRAVILGMVIGADFSRWLW